MHKYHCYIPILYPAILLNLFVLTLVESLGFSICKIMYSEIRGNFTSFLTILMSFTYLPLPDCSVGWALQLPEFSGQTF